VTSQQRNQQSQSSPGGSDWLSPFLGRLHTPGPKLLELGCGLGYDAATLFAAGFEVTAFDHIRMDEARANAPSAHLLRADLRLALPFRSGIFDSAMASLSLHYLPWAETRRAFEEVRRVVRTGAPFLFRVNANDDYAHGAGQGELLEPNFYRDPRHYHSDTKRFFDEAMVRAVIEGLFEPDSLEHRTIVRDGRAKRVWECLAIAR